MDCERTRPFELRVAAELHREHLRYPCTTQRARVGQRDFYWKRLLHPG